MAVDSFDKVVAHVIVLPGLNYFVKLLIDETISEYTSRQSKSVSETSYKASFNCVIYSTKLVSLTIFNESYTS